MLDEKEDFSLPLARLLWEATWDDKSPVASTRRSPFPSTDYQTGVMKMPDGSVVSAEVANLYTSQLMAVLRTALHKGPDNNPIPTKEELRVRKAAAALAEKERRLADEQAGRRPHGHRDRRRLCSARRSSGARFGHRTARAGHVCVAAGAVPCTWLSCRRACRGCNHIRLRKTRPPLRLG